MARPIADLERWAKLHDASFHSIKPAPAGEGRGSGLIATRDLDGSTQNGPLLVVPRDLVLSKQTVELLAKSDKDLRALLEALDEFVSTSRGAIVTFLLYCRTVYQARAADPPYHVGSLTPFIDYVQFLPQELLPTFWSNDEVSVLQGTSLAAALSAKQKSLSREFGTLRNATENIKWCQDLWWSPSSSPPFSELDLQDWKQVDAMYRSRALEFPGIGDAMVPCVDVANHAAGDATSALYETDADGNAILLLRPGVTVKEGDEVTITYGDTKGACEMLFSYGFIDSSMVNAGELFLPLDMAEDDPLAPAKKHISPFTPGVKIEENRKRVEGLEHNRANWHSDFVYLSILNQEDGLDFAIAQTTDGERELQMLWHGSSISLSELKDFKQDVLWGDELFSVFQLRAAVTVLECVNQQLKELARDGFAESVTMDRLDLRDCVYDQVLKLRDLEKELLEHAVKSLEWEIDVVSGDRTVKRWLALQRGEEYQPGNSSEEEEESEDFT